MIARNRHRIEIANLLLREIFLHVAHEFEGKFGAENAGVLGLVFLQDIGLHRAAHLSQRIGFYFLVNIGRQHLVARGAEQAKPQNGTICFKNLNPDPSPKIRRRVGVEVL